MAELPQGPSSRSHVHAHNYTTLLISGKCHFLPVGAKKAQETVLAVEQAKEHSKQLVRTKDRLSTLLKAYQIADTLHLTQATNKRKFIDPEICITFYFKSLLIFLG